MTGKVVKELATFPINGDAVTNTTIQDNLNILEAQAFPETVTYTPTQVATIVCFMVGIWQVW